MTFRPVIFALLTALAVLSAGLPLGAEDAKDAKPDQPKQPAPPKPDSPRDGKPDNKGDNKDGEKRPPRGEWNRGPGGEWGGPRPSNRFEQFSPDELREMISAVESKNKKLADKMKERLADAIAKKPTQLSKEQIDAALAVFEDREPHLASRLKEYLKDNPERVNAILAGQWPRLASMIDLKKNDRELYDAQTAEIQKLNDSRGVSWKLRQAIKDKNQPEIEKLKTELLTKLTEQHKARQDIRKLELARMNDKIKKLSEEITAEEAKSAEQIKKHFDGLMKWIESPRGWDKGEKGGDKPDKHEKKEKPE